MSKRLTARQQSALQALVYDGLSRRDAAKQAGVTIATLSRWFNHDELFIKQYEYECELAHQSAVNLSRLRAEKALDKLCRLLVCGNERVELAAAKEILNLAEYKTKPAERVENNREFTVNIKVV